MKIILNTLTIPSNHKKKNNDHTRNGVFTRRKYLLN